MLTSLGDRVIDVGSEWRTFSNDKATKDPSRVGDSQNPLLSDGDLSTMIGKVIIPFNRKCQGGGEIKIWKVRSFYKSINH